VSPEFLTLDDVLEMHEQQLGRYGGAPGLRDQGLLESALAQPMATFGGELLHEDLFVMASAYLFHLVKNHPFVDGNKRIGLLAALVFLDMNGVSIEQGTEELYELTISVAEGRRSKDQVAERFLKLAATSQ
jgi:death on curing protein